MDARGLVTKIVSRSLDPLGNPFRLCSGGQLFLESWFQYWLAFFLAKMSGYFAIFMTNIRTDAFGWELTIMEACKAIWLFIILEGDTMRFHPAWVWWLNRKYLSFPIFQLISMFEIWWILNCCGCDSLPCSHCLIQTISLPLRLAMGYVKYKSRVTTRNWSKAGRRPFNFPWKGHFWQTFLLTLFLGVEALLVVLWSPMWCNFLGCLSAPIAWYCW